MADEDEMPVALRRLWGLEAPARLGRPAQLDLDRVLDAAIDLADRDGLAGVTLAKVSGALGYTTMSLYRHIGSKDELLVLMQEHAMGMPPATEDLPADWREGLRSWAAFQRRLYHRRPWLPHVPVTGPPSGPRQVAWMEMGLSILRNTGLDWAQKIGTLMLLSGFVREASLLSQSLERGRRSSGLNQGEAERAYGRCLAKLVEPDRYPETARLFRSGLFETVEELPQDPAAHGDFVFGLERILDGVAVSVEAAATPDA